MPLASGTRLVIASHNPGKVHEIAQLLARFPVEAVGARSLGLPEPGEPGDSFAANSALKAEAAARASGLPALADDSGLCVAALGGAPGIRSARWAGEERDFTYAMKRVEEEIGGNPDRRAYFVCALALAQSGEPTRIYEGHVFGSLVFPPRGEKGFGYDPIFVPEGSRFTFGEMNPKERDAISHRARAFAKLAVELPE